MTVGRAEDTLSIISEEDLNKNCKNIITVSRAVWHRARPPVSFTLTMHPLGVTAIILQRSHVSQSRNITRIISLCGTVPCQSHPRDRDGARCRSSLCRLFTGTYCVLLSFFMRDTLRGMRTARVKVVDLPLTVKNKLSYIKSVYYLKGLTMQVLGSAAVHHDGSSPLGKADNIGTWSKLHLL